MYKKQQKIMAKYLDLAGLTAYDKKIKEWIKSGVVDITEDAIRVLFVTVAEGPAGNEIWYTTSDGNVVTPNTTDLFGADVFEANIVSNTYENGKGVIKFDGYITRVGDDAFDNCRSLTSITIPNSVTSIGDRAFYDCRSSLTSITIPNTVTSIGTITFYNCSGLTYITIPNSLTNIGEKAFASCSSITSITFEGTMAQWNAISKGDDWNINVPATHVQCTDGQVKL